MDKPDERLRGVLTFHSETSTEGGDWAFQDARHIRQLADHELIYSCTKCGLWRGAGPNGPRVVVSVPLPEICGPDDHVYDVTTREAWSYEGLHILESGDRLTIFDKAQPTAVVWSGTVALKQFDVFTEHAYGYWIHAEQVGVKRDVWARWFLEGNPAELIKART